MKASINSPQRKFLKQAAISQYLRCSICLQVFTQPKRTYCGHTFCKSCLQSCMTANSACPKCRVNINRIQIGDDLIATAIINQLEVVCPCQECPWRGECVLLNEHFLICQYKNVKPKKKQKNGNMQMLVQDEEVQDKINQNLAKGSFMARLKMKCGGDFKVFQSKTVDLSVDKVEKMEDSYSETNRHPPKSQNFSLQLEGRTRRGKAKPKAKNKKTNEKNVQVPVKEKGNLQFLDDLF